MIPSLGRQWSHSIYVNIPPTGSLFALGERANGDLLWPAIGWTCENILLLLVAHINYPKVHLQSNVIGLLDKNVICFGGGRGGGWSSYSILPVNFYGRCSVMTLLTSFIFEFLQPKKIPNCALRTEHCWPTFWRPCSMLSTRLNSVCSCWRQWQLFILPSWSYSLFFIVFHCLWQQANKKLTVVRAPHQNCHQPQPMPIWKNRWKQSANNPSSLLH